MVQAHESVYTHILKASVLLVFSTHCNLKMNCRFQAEADIFTVKSGLLPLKQLLQTVLLADKREIALAKSYAQHLEKKEKKKPVGLLSFGQYKRP